MPEVAAIALDLSIVVALVLLGALLTQLVLGKGATSAIASLAFPIGSGVFTWLLFLCSWAGLQLNQVSIPVIYCLALGILLLVHRAVRPRRRFEQVQLYPTSFADEARTQRLGLIAAAGLFLAIMAPLAIGRAHSYWDAAAGWIVKGYGIALEGDIRAGETWGAWGLSYPLNIPLQATLFQVFDGDRLPGSMLVFPLYALSMAMGIHRFWRKQSVGELQSLLGMLVLLTNPLILLHSSVGYANLPTTAYVVLGACWMVEGLAERRTPETLMGSLLFGLGGWTRAEAASYGLLALPALLLLARVMRRGQISPGSALLPFAILVGVWFAFGGTAVHEGKLGGAVGSVLPTMQAGEFRLFELYLIPRLLAERALEPKTWGYLFQVAGVLSLGGLPRLLRRRASLAQWAICLTTAVFVVIPIGLFYVQSYTLQKDFIPLLNRSFDRAFMPAATMLLVLGVLLFFGEAGIGRESDAASP